MENGLLHPMHHFEYPIMPFGLINALAMFMHLMHQDLLDTFVVIYLDDVLAYSSLPEKHWTHVLMVLQYLQKNPSLSIKSASLHRS